ncbi:hypothetical protein N9Y42_01730 [Mariniblastus sp.]|nr:hypothetical protein [Mariniblastus sp.]
MPDNPYSSPKTNVRTNLPSLAVRLGTSRTIFLAVAFGSTWIVFYAAYLINGIGYGYLEAESETGLFITTMIVESTVVALIVSALSATPLLNNPKITLKNYGILAFVCILEFTMAYWFFVAFFEI